LILSSPCFSLYIGNPAIVSAGFLPLSRSLQGITQRKPFIKSDCPAIYGDHDFAGPPRLKDTYCFAPEWIATWR